MVSGDAAGKDCNGSDQVSFGVTSDVFTWA